MELELRCATPIVAALAYVDDIQTFKNDFSTLPHCTCHTSKQLRLRCIRRCAIVDLLRIGVSFESRQRITSCERRATNQLLTTHTALHYDTTHITPLHSCYSLIVVSSCTAMWLLHSSSHRCSSGVRVTVTAAVVIIVLLTLTTAITTNAQNTNTANDAASTLVEQTPIASSVVASPSLVVASYPFDGSSLCDSSLARLLVVCCSSTLAH